MAPQGVRVGEAVQQHDGRTFAFVLYGKCQIAEGDVLHRSVLLSGADEREQLGTIGPGRRRRIGERERSLGHARACRDVAPRSSNDDHVDVPAEQVRDPCMIEAARALAQSPAGIVGLVWPALDLRLDLGQAVTVEGKRLGEVRLDPLGRSARPSASQGPGIVDRFLAKHRPQRGSVHRCRSRSPRPSDGLVHAHASASGDHAGGNRRAVDDVRALTVLDLGHQLDVGDRLGVDPVGNEWVADARPSPSSRRPSWPRSARPSRLVMTPTPQVPLSAGSVRTETEP